MENINKFTYITEPGDYHGTFWLYEGECTCKDERILYFTEEKELVDFLKKNPDNVIAIATLDENEKVLTEGERLSKVLNLDFIHP